jgi:hypothetical protein
MINGGIKMAKPRKVTIESNGLTSFTNNYLRKIQTQRLKEQVTKEVVATIERFGGR